ncbi:hypothetical protein [Pleomorphovibrio marinus]|uniref:hypothetical protein n=1 Tax=Pleomorphovibrio marinus TaxID=2164132 RepID=UPI0013002943|nr:hypothetical protein [Pleomorphovibrio marinus]
MKDETNQKNKAKFFVLYWGQEVLSAPLNTGHLRETYAVQATEMYDIQSCYLELKPLSQISDEDAIALGYPDAGDIIASYDIEDDLPHSLADGLRGLGYAVPYMGLSVDEMVQAGWIKLVGKEAENG